MRSLRLKERARGEARTMWYGKRIKMAYKASK
nr:MAG TPA: hypothetical protein [Caudoviricetes sp.]